MGEFLAKHPFFRPIVALILGIVVFVSVGFSKSLFFGLLTVSVAGQILNVLRRLLSPTLQKHLELSSGLSLMLFVVAMGYGLSYLNDKKIPVLPEEGESGIFLIELTKFPIEKENSVLLYADLLEKIDSNRVAEISGNVSIYVAKDSAVLSLRSGDRLLVSTSLSLPKKSGNPDEFDYGKYLRRHGVCGSGYVNSDSWQKVGSAKGFSLVRFSQNARQRLLEIYQKSGIRGKEYGIVAALTLGYTDAISPEVRDSFSVTGVAHILSVSGLHVGIIYVFLGYMLAFMDKKRGSRRMKNVIIILFLWFYALMTGLSAAVCRSALMFSVVALGRVIDRRSSIYNSIFFSAFILLIINPMWLFDVGFQLSYTALISIIYFQPKILALIPTRTRVGRYLWELVSVSIAAQILATPLCLYYFHQFPNYFILANVVAVPLSTIIIYGNVILLALYKFPFLCKIVGLCVMWLTKILYACLHFIEELAYAVSRIWIDEWQLVAISIFVVGLGFLFYKVRARYFAVMLLGVVMFLGLQLWRGVENSGFSDVVVFSDSKSLTINTIDNRQSQILTTDSLTAIRLNRDFLLRKGVREGVITELDTATLFHTFQFQGNTFAVVANNEIYDLYSPAPLEVDYLIVGKEVKASKSLLKYYFQPKRLVVLSTQYKTQKFSQIAEEHGVEFYSVREQGAFRLNGE